MNTRIRDFGYKVGNLPCGTRNKITDVPGVRVGHWTIDQDRQHTGLTVILPGTDNCFLHKYTASGYVHNGFGKTCGLVQVEELGTLETPIVLTNTLNVGRVADAVVSYMIEETRKNGTEIYSINPVVGECNDSQINDIQNRLMGEKQLKAAIEAAQEEFEEGDVGAGAGTICYGLKGGIGSASRILTIGEHNYTIGILVQTNFGSTIDLTLNGEAIGKEIVADTERTKDGLSTEDRGSIMTILATDLPVSDRQLYRIIRRCGVGIARTGAYSGHGSGEVMIGFTTANRIDTRSEVFFREYRMINEDLINMAFEAAAEATQEAIYNSMSSAKAKAGLDGKQYRSLAQYLV